MAELIFSEAVCICPSLPAFTPSAAPLEEVERSVAGDMKKFGIRCFFQKEDVYNKRKILLVFNSARNLLELELCAEILSVSAKKAGPAKKGAAPLEGIGLKTVTAIAEGLELSSETEYLFHTLKLMGFRICIIVQGFDLFLNPLGVHAGIDYICSNRLLSEKGVLTGKTENLVQSAEQREKLIAKIAKEEKLKKGDIIRIGDSEPVDIKLDDCGVRFTLERKVFNQLIRGKSIKPEQIPSILSAFGPLAKS